MAKEERIYYRSADNGPWQQLDAVAPRSVIGVALASKASGEIYIYDSGPCVDRYKWLPAPSVPQKRN